MTNDVQIAAFEGGSLRVLKGAAKGGEAVLALPLSRLLVKVLCIPEENREDPVGYAAEALKAISPFPDEPLTVSCETVCETARGTVVVAAALPESATDDIAEALDAAKLNVTRVDALVLGELRGLWSQFAGTDDNRRRMVLVKGPDCVSLMVLDGQLPVAVRALSTGCEMRREVMLSLLEAEDFHGAVPLAEALLVEKTVGEWSDAESAVLSAFAPVRRLPAPDADSALVGVAERTADPGTLDALPDSWRTVLAETRFKRKLKGFLIVAGAIWALVMGVLFGVPIAYGFMTDHQKALCQKHRNRYNTVATMREKVKIVRKYSDHTTGALEILKAVSDRLPENVELGSWNFRREDGVRVSGEAATASDVYKFKDTLIEAGVFADVLLTGPTAGKGGRQRFDIDCKFTAEDEQ